VNFAHHVDSITTQSIETENALQEAKARNSPRKPTFINGNPVMDREMLQNLANTGECELEDEISQPDPRSTLQNLNGVAILKRSTLQSAVRLPNEMRASSMGFCKFCVITSRANIRNSHTRNQC
jgi:hypothetical protein